MNESMTSRCLCAILAHSMNTHTNEYQAVNSAVEQMQHYSCSFTAVELIQPLLLSKAGSNRDTNVMLLSAHALFDQTDKSWV